MLLRSLIGAHAGEVRDYSPIAARGALANGLACRIDETPEGPDRPEPVRAAPSKTKTPQARKKGD